MNPSNPLESVYFINIQDVELSHRKRFELDKTIPIPTKNNDELEQEYNSLQEQNNSLSSNISSLTKEKDSLEKKKMELITTNNNLQEKFEEVKNINDDEKDS